jgi:hypothetical protein
VYKRELSRFALVLRSKCTINQHDSHDLQWLAFNCCTIGTTKEVLRMSAIQEIRPTQVIGPLGAPLTRATLPPPQTSRWVIRRKAEVVAAVRGGLLTVDEACQLYSLSIEEFASWQNAVDRSGISGLRVTKIQYYRELYRRHPTMADQPEQVACCA